MSGRDGWPVRAEGTGQARWPGAVPEEDGAAAALDLGDVDVRWGADTDADGRPDTLLGDDGTDLLVHTDLDGDGMADRLLRIGPDGVVQVAAEGAGPADVGGSRAGPDPDPAVTGSVDTGWAGLIGRLLGPGT